MTNPSDPFSEQLGRLLADAANGFDARPDLPRLHRMLGSPGRRRGAVVVFSAAACLALLGGAVVAVNGGDDSRIAPAVGSSQPASSAPKELLVPTTTEDKPDGTEKPQPPKVTTPDVGKPDEPAPPTTLKPAPPPTTEKPAPPTTLKPAPPPTTEKPAPPTTLKPPPPPTTEKPAPPTTIKPPPPPTAPWVWAANQVFGTCAEDPPYETFYGTTAPGAKVRAEAAYGSGYIYADEQGNWELTVFFPEAPLDTPFKVTVWSEGSTSYFWFTRVA